MNNQNTKPIIGLVGGIGSGKTLVAQELGRLGCLVIDSDELAHRVLEDPTIKNILIQWWGGGIINNAGQVDRQALGRIAFSNEHQISRLNALIHPEVDKMRKKIMTASARDDNIPAVVWDSPLLIENGLYEQCDAVIFVKTSLGTRLDRLCRTRHWTIEEVLRREKMQMSLDKKEKMAHYCLSNDGDVSVSLNQVRSIFSRILARITPIKPS